MGCSFIVTAAGSFVGNLGANIVEEKMKEPKKEKWMKIFLWIMGAGVGIFVAFAIIYIVAMSRIHWV